MCWTARYDTVSLVARAKTVARATTTLTTTATTTTDEKSESWSRRRRRRRRSFPVDAHVRMGWSFAAMGKREDMFVIRGTKGELTMSTFGDDPIIVETWTSIDDGSKSSKVCIPSKEITNEEYKYELPEHAQMPLIQTIVDELRGVEDFPSPSRGDNSLGCAMVMDEVLKEYYGGNRSDAFWTRKETWLTNS